MSEFESFFFSFNMAVRYLSSAQGMSLLCTSGVAIGIVPVKSFLDGVPPGVLLEVGPHSVTK